jgi:hypothetical protein
MQTQKQAGGKAATFAPALIGQLQLPHFLQASKTIFPIERVDECQHDRIPSGRLTTRGWAATVSGRLHGAWKMVSSRGPIDPNPGSPPVSPFFFGGQSVASVLLSPGQFCRLACCTGSRARCPRKFLARLGPAPFLDISAPGQCL